MPRPKKTAAKKVTKTAYVLGLARDLPAKDVVAKAKAAGITLTDKHVYSIRSGAKARKAKTGPKMKTGPKAGSKRLANGAGNGSIESRFVDLAMDVGLARAEEMLGKLRAKVKGIVL